MILKKLPENKVILFKMILLLKYINIYNDLSDEVFNPLFFFKKYC